MNISWDDARLFLAVAETGSFSAAAKRLALGQPTVSRRIADLEYQLGWALFHRGKGGAQLTDEAAKLVPAAQQMSRWAAELERSAAGNERVPAGTVRVAAPPGISYDVLVQFCKELKPQYPQLDVEILASVEHLDLARGEADLAIRTRPPTESELVLLTTFETQVQAFAAPEYVAGLPNPCSVDQVDWITWCYPYEHVIPRPQLEQMIPNFKPAFASDNYLIQARACELGLGALLMSDIKHPLLRKMGLVRVPLDIQLPRFSSHLVTAKSLEHVPRVRAVANALVRQFDMLQPGDGTL